jgi:hypothetical protein
MRLLICIVILTLMSGCLMTKEASPAGSVASGCNEGDCYGLNGTGQDSCLLDVAIRCNKQPLCGKILDKEMEYRCLLHYNDYDMILCAGIANDTVKKECYLNGAEMKLDATLCDKIQDRYYRMLCLARVAHKTNNRMLCDKIQDKVDQREFCFAVADNEYRICSNIINDDLRAMCIEWTVEQKVQGGLHPTN